MIWLILDAFNYTVIWKKKQQQTNKPKRKSKRKTLFRCSRDKCIFTLCFVRFRSGFDNTEFKWCAVKFIRFAIFSEFIRRIFLSRFFFYFFIYFFLIRFLFWNRKVCQPNAKQRLKRTRAHRVFHNITDEVLFKSYTHIRYVTLHYITAQDNKPN